MISTKQKAALYDFAIDNNLLNDSELQREIASQLRSVRAAGDRLEALLPTADTDEEPEAPAAPRATRRSGRGKRTSAAAPPAAAPKPRVTRAKAASRKLQGQYLALIRLFPKAARVKYSAIAKSAGREQAISDMQAELSRIDGI